MAAHYVVCKYCGKRFNRDKEEAIAIDGRRYVHKACYEQYINKNNKEELDYKALEQYIKELFNIDTLTMRIKKQIKDYKTDYNYTYSGMLKALKWWFEIKHNSIEKANNGIGIIPYIYTEAYNYYYAIFLANEYNKANNKLKKVPHIKEIVIEAPQVSIKQPKLFNL